MERQKEAKWTTEQGRDTPVPVGVGGSRAGPPRPSSDDCPAKPVGDQAGSLVLNTGKKTREERRSSLPKLNLSGSLPTCGEMSIDTKAALEDTVRLGYLGKQKDKLANIFLESRNAVSAPTSPMTNVQVLDLTWDEAGERSVKRKRAEGNVLQTAEEAKSAEERLARSLRKTLKDVDKDVRALAELAKERNTKKEIKDLASRLRSMMSLVMSDTNQQLMQNLGKTDREGKCAACQMRQGVEIRKVSVETQTETKKFVEGDTDIRAVKGFDDYCKLENLQWRRNVFKKAFIVQGSPLKANEDTDLIYLAEESISAGENASLKRKMLERFPDLEVLEGEVAKIKISTSTELNGEMKVKDRYIFKVEVEEDRRAFYSRLETVRDIMVKQGRQKMALYPPGNDARGQKTRKMLECILNGTQVKGLVYIGGTAPQVKSGRNTFGKFEKERDTEVIWVKRGERTYADLLKKVKEKVIGNSQAVRGIRTIREARNGEMIIVVDKEDRNGVDELKKQLSGEELEVRIGKNNKEKKVILKGVDGLTTGTDVAQAISEEMGIPPERVKMGNFRPIVGGNKAVTISLEPTVANKLINKGKIRIGLNLCTTQERLEVVQCYKCWSYGHRRDECTSPNDMSKVCRKCTRQGHLEKDCEQNIPICLNCKRPGHRAGSGSCPEFRKALDRARLLKRKKAAY